MANQDLRTARRTAQDIKASIPDPCPETVHCQIKAIKIAMAAVSNLNRITQCVLEFRKDRAGIQEWEVFKRLRSRLSCSHRVHTNLKESFPQENDTKNHLVDLGKALSAWDKELQKLWEKAVENGGTQTASQSKEELQQPGTLSEKDAEGKDIPPALRSGEELQGSGTPLGNNPEPWDVPMASELELLIELHYKFSDKPPEDIGQVEDFLKGLTSKLGNLKPLPKGPGRSAEKSNPKPQPKGSDRGAGMTKSKPKPQPKGSNRGAGMSNPEPQPGGSDCVAGMPRVVFFCLGHGGLICAATRPSYKYNSPLDDIFKCLRQDRLDNGDQGAMEERMSKYDRDVGKLDGFEPFDHPGEQPKQSNAFRLDLDKDGTPHFNKCARCLKCRELYKYECDESSLTEEPTRFPLKTCAEDLCYTYCVKGETMSRDPQKSFF